MELTINLPQEFLDICDADGVEPDEVVRGFIADLAEINSSVSGDRDDRYCSNGGDERMLAREYYDRVGYSYRNDMMAESAGDTA